MGCDKIKFYVDFLRLTPFSVQNGSGAACISSFIVLPASTSFNVYIKFIFRAFPLPKKKVNVELSLSELRMCCPESLPTLLP